MRKIYTILASALVLCLASCDYLDKTPQSEISPEDYFQTETDLILFTNPYYNNLLDKDPYEEQSDHQVETTLEDRMLGGTYRTVPSTGGSWTWGTLRRINTLIKYADNCSDEEVRDYYVALSKFFRAFFYFEKVKRFGDVPWYDTPLDSDSDELYKARDTREYVMTKMIEDVDEAIDVLDDDVSVYRANKWAALALKSRFCLFEGTFRKYHDVSYDDHDYTYYLELAADAALQIMESGVYKLASDYLTLFAEVDADENEYILAINNDKSLAIYVNTNAYALMSSQGCPGLTKKYVDSFLMTDGTRFTDKDGWSTMEFAEAMVDRDPRLACQTRCPGYTRIGGTTVLAPDFGCSSTGFQLVKFVMDCTLASVDRVDMSYNDIPVYRLGEVYLNYAEALAELGTLTQDDLDISVNLLRARVGMPDMSLSEANADPDPYLSSSEYGYSNVTGSNTGIILEIRRERAIELYQEAFRWWDLMRWKEGPCIEQAMYGPYFPGEGVYDLTGDDTPDVCLYLDTKPDYSSTYPDIVYWQIGEATGGILLSDGDSGYIDPQQNIARSFDEERDYLYPIPTEERELNPNLTQNPGWNDGLTY